MYLLCSLAALIALLWFFAVNLLENYLARTIRTDMFYFEVLLLAIFSVVITFGLFCLLRAIFFTHKMMLICSALVVLCALLSFSFRFEFVSASDRFYFWVNESAFRRTITNTSGGTKVVLYRSSHNFNKLFVYSGLYKLNDGLVPMKILEELGAELDILYGSCRVYSKFLRDDFYVLSIDC
jgi:hypothetical protein